MQRVSLVLRPRYAEHTLESLGLGPVRTGCCAPASHKGLGATQYELSSSGAHRDEEEAGGVGSKHNVNREIERS